MPAVSISKLEIAIECLDPMMGNTAYVSKRTGDIHVLPADIDAGVEVPDDVEVSDDYIELPDKHIFDLGNELVFRFTKAELPDEYDKVRGMFGHKGAFRRFKDLLHSTKKLDRWHKFEADQTQSALRAWCAEQGFDVKD